MFKALLPVPLALLVGCGAEKELTIPDPLLEFEVVDCGVAYATSITEFSVEAVDSSQRFQELYLATDLNNQGEIPAVDFDTKTVIAIHLDPRPSTAYSIEVTSITESADAVVVHYDESTPGMCAAGTAITHPYCFVAIDKTAKPVEHEVTETTACVNP